MIISKCLRADEVIQTRLRSDAEKIAGLIDLQSVPCVMDRLGITSRAD
jgi:hypothetical protein